MFSSKHIAVDIAGMRLNPIEPVIVQFLTFHRKESEKTGEVWAKGIIRVDMEYRDKTVRQLFATSFGTRRFLSTIGLEGRLNFEAAADETAEAKRAPQLRGIAEATTEGAVEAPPPDPAAGDVLDEQSGPEAARTQLHTGRDKSKPVKRDVH